MAVTKERGEELIERYKRGARTNKGFTVEEVKELQEFLQDEGIRIDFTSKIDEQYKAGDEARDGKTGSAVDTAVKEYLNRPAAKVLGTKTTGYLDTNADTGEEDSVSQSTSATENLIKTGTEEFNKQKTESSQRELLRRDLKRKRDNTAVDVYNMADVGLTGYKLADAARLRREGKADEKIAEAALQQRGPMGQRNPYLQDALNRAVVNAERGLSPQVRADLNRQSLNTLNAGIQAARTAGTGQAGTYGALASTAGLNRLRGFERMATLDQQFRNQNRQLLGNLIGQRSAEDKMLLGAEQMDFFRRRVPYLQAKLAGASATQQAGRKQMFDTLEGVPYMAGNLAKTYYNLPAQRRGIFGNEPVASTTQEVAVSPTTPVTYTAPDSGLPLISNPNGIPSDRRLRKQQARKFILANDPLGQNPGEFVKLNPYDGIVDEGLDQGVPMTGILPPRFY